MVKFLKSFLGSKSAVASIGEKSVFVADFDLTGKTVTSINYYPEGLSNTCYTLFSDYDPNYTEAMVMCNSAAHAFRDMIMGLKTSYPPMLINPFREEYNFLNSRWKVLNDIFTLVEILNLKASEVYRRVRRVI